MKSMKGKAIAVSSLAALGGLAAIALGSQSGPNSGDGAAAFADGTGIEPRVERQVVRRVKHVEDRSAAPGVAAEATAAGAAVPVTAAASTPARSAAAYEEGETEEIAGDDLGDDDRADEYTEAEEQEEYGEHGDD